MIEAVNSVVANASVLRASAGQVDASKGPADNIQPAAASDSVAEAPKAPYISPYIALDYNFDQAVLQIRDSETGDVEEQFPSESRMAEARRAQEYQQRVDQLRTTVSTADSGGSEAGSSSSTPQPASSGDVITVQDVTSAAAPSNSSAPSPAPQAAVAAFSAGAQSGSSPSSAGVSVLA